MEKIHFSYRLATHNFRAMDKQHNCAILEYSENDSNFQINVSDIIKMCPFIRIQETAIKYIPSVLFIIYYE